MKIRQIAAVISAAALVLSLSSCLDYKNESETTTEENSDNGGEYGNSNDIETVTDENGSVFVLIEETSIVSVGQTEAQTAAPVISNDATDSSQVSNDTVTTPQSSTGGNTNTNANTNTNTNSGGSTTTKSQKTGLDVLKSGTFYWKGSMVDSDGTSTPTEMAATSDSLYISTSMSGAQIGLLMKGSDTYIIYPKIKGYMNMSTLSSIPGLGLDSDDFLDRSAADFSDLGDLSDADSTKQTTFNGKSCTAYVFGGSGSTTEIYMSGATLLGMQTLNSGTGKVESAMIFDALYATVPSDKSGIPSGYTEYKGLKAISFMTQLAQDMDIEE